jgi:Flp pilus assembly secretin CpaC
MNFRQTAALGLSSLLLSGNLIMPYAVATTMAVSNQPELATSLAQLDQHSFLAVGENRHPAHPVLLKKHRGMPQAFESVLSFWNSRHKPFKLAQTFHLQKWIKTTSAALPIEPNFKINPQITMQMPAMPALMFQPQGGTDAVSAPQSPASTSVSQPLAITEAPDRISDDAPQVVGTGEVESPAQADDSAAAEACQLKPGETKIAKAEQKEAFQLLASSPLDKLAALSQQMRTRSAPRMDNSPSAPSSAPNVSLKGNGAVKVLKSGVSTRMTNIELTVGKAEVIYLSRPAGRIAVSNPDVASAVVISPTQIQLIGKTVGVSNLLIWNNLSSTDHTVVDISVHRDVSVLVNQLKYVDPGIQIMPMAAEDTVIMSGEAESRESAQLAIEMAKAFFNKTAAAPQQNVINSMSSQAPGSALPGVTTNVINLIKVKGEPSTKIELVRQRLKDIDPNIKIDVVPGPDGNEKVILTGRVATASIASKALNMASVFYGQPGIKLITAQGGNEFARMEINGTGNTQSATTTAGGGNGAGNAGVNVLQGSVLTDATGSVISMLEVAQKPQIKCSIKFLELNKTALNALGGTISGTSGNSMLASWSGVQSAAPGKPISVMSTQDMSGSAWSTLKNSAGVSQLTQGRFNEVFQNGVTQVFSINNQLTGAIQALQEKKQVRTLAEPTLTMLSGEQASFLAGGEIPIAFVGGQGQVSIQYKEFGIRLNLLPTVTDDGKIQMQVAPEVSALDQTKGVSTNSISVPAFVSRRMQTTLIVEPGQSFALAGLYNQEDTDSISRFPGLGALPIIGAFFRNSWKNKSTSEMVVIIKPEVIMTQTGTTRQAAEASPAPLLPVETKPQVSKVSNKSS